MIFLPVAGELCSLVPAMNVSILGPDSVLVSWFEDDILDMFAQDVGEVTIILYEYNTEIGAANDILEIYTV